MGFSRQEYWSGLPSPPPGDLPDPGIKPASLVSPALVGGFFTTEPHLQKKIKPILHKHLQKNEEDEVIFNSFHEVSVTTTKMRQRYCKKVN